jgi:hypothetical protein
MVLLVLPDVFAFFDSVSAKPVSLAPARREPPAGRYTGRFHSGSMHFDLRGRQERFQTLEKGDVACCLEF